MVIFVLLDKQRNNCYFEKMKDGDEMRAEIISLLIERTQEETALSVQEIAETLHQSRNLIARTINTMMEDKVLIRIGDEKRKYYHKKTLEEKYQVELLTGYVNEQRLLDALQKEEQYDFQKLIGYQDSLSDCVELCKAAISYPQNALAFLLNGPTGTGKSLIAQLTYEYAVNNGIIDAEKPFVTLNCSEYANNPELLSANLFGHKKGAYTGADQDNAGLLQVANGGILFLDEVHCLKAECQEKLFLFIDKGIYHKIGENEKWESAQVRLIFATTEKPEKVLLKTFLRRIPIIVNVPSLNERGVHEKIQLIYSVLANEEKRIHKDMFISNFVYNAFLNYDYEGNIGELKNTIQVSCAHALAHAKDHLEIHMENLPNKMFARDHKKQRVLDEGDHRMIRIHELDHHIDHDNSVIALYATLLESDKNVNMLDQNLSSIRSYYDKVTFHQQQNETNKHTYILETMEHTIKKVFQKYGCKINNNDLLSLFRYLEDMRRNPLAIRNWCQKQETKIQEYSQKIRHVMIRESEIAQEIQSKLRQNLDIAFDDMFANVLAFTLRQFNHNMEVNRRVGIILAHGYSTASSIADAANKLLDDYIFDSIDMPIEESTEKVIEELNQYLHSHNNFEELVLLVDMGSLEQIYTGMDIQNEANIGIINNITTKLALEIGSELRNGVDLETLLKHACEGSYSQYRILERKKKEDAIVCVCASGVGTAEKIKKLLGDSLPATANIHLLTYDYNMLMAQKKNCEFFDKYNVMGIIGTLDPVIEDVTFISIEDLIVEQDVEKIDEILCKHMGVEEIQIFKQEILKNFSLNNVMDVLTILNPNKLMEHVAIALDEFQKRFGIHIRSNTSVGLYVHVCCMIERLVMRVPCENYLDITYLEEHEQRFIQCIKESFLQVENYYGIELLNDEIGYIYDYVHNGQEEEW